MITLSRRTFIGTAALAFGSLGKPRGAEASLRGLLGCCILPDSGGDFAISSNQPEKAPTVEYFLESITDNSGLGSEYERQLGRVLVRMARVFDVNPGFGFYDDAVSMNAFAVNKRWVPNTKGTVSFGRRMLRHQMRIDPRGISVAAICAHEFAHIFQYTSGYYDEISSQLPGYCVELHADYLSGYFLYFFKEDRPTMNLNNVGQAWEEMGSADFTDPGSHGTSDQRLDAIQQGYFDARDLDSESDLRSAAERGFEHVAQLS